MKKMIILPLVLLLLVGCAGRNGERGSAAGVGNDGASTASGEEAAHSIRCELGDLKDTFFAVPTSAKPDELVEIRTHVLFDADIHVYLDGQEIEKVHYDSDYWGYPFTMPDKDVVITAKPYTKNEIWGLGGDDVDFVKDVQYVRTDGYINGEAYPKFFWISSAEEMQEYYESNKEKYWLDSESFAAARKKYDASFFEEYDLIVILLEEGSGSVRHELSGVNVSPSQSDGKKYLLQPEIKRLVPEAGTCDMAEWHILIEIRKDHGASVSELAEPVFQFVSR